MPQGKLKVKAKIPVGAKVKQRTIAKAKDVQKRNRPAQRKKAANAVGAAITRAINENNETTVREKAVVDGKTLHILPSDDVLPAEKAGLGSAGGAKPSTSSKKNQKKSKNKK
ncbi:uncharacterized protein LOC110846415 [Folsomia candida]|uniref:Uncharacterized protein n=1 Tax=Folsomia candida TaxID=158441 RepID=A0A226EQJ0_FOLCA|nr:uncharacterized protein LOC110846415 [Folsomia candida]OXA58856.1 hypothetical protein Fcan01_07814 [Folsomia candida]